MDPVHRPDLSTIGKRIRYARDKRGLPARKLSLAAGLQSITHVGVIENRKEDGGVSAEIALKLAHALQVPVEWLVNGGEEPTWDEPAATDEPARTGS